MSIKDDIEFGLNMLALSGFRDRTPLLQPDPTSAIMDQYVGQRLAQGESVLLQWNDQRVPNFRASEDGDLVDVQNRARYELYFKRLGAAGFNPDELHRRQQRGLRVKARIRAIRSRFFGKPKSVIHEQAGVHGKLKVVK